MVRVCSDFDGGSAVTDILKSSEGGTMESASERKQANLSLPPSLVHLPPYSFVSPLSSKCLLSSTRSRAALLNFSNLVVYLPLPVTPLPSLHEQLTHIFLSLPPSLPTRLS